MGSEKTNIDEAFDNLDIIEGIKNKIAMKTVEKISSTCKKNGDIKWNFTKFLVDKDGKTLYR